MLDKKIRFDQAGHPVPADAEPAGVDAMYNLPVYLCRDCKARLDAESKPRVRIKKS